MTYLRARIPHHSAIHCQIPVRSCVTDLGDAVLRICHGRTWGCPNVAADLPYDQCEARRERWKAHAEEKVVPENFRLHSIIEPVVVHQLAMQAEVVSWNKREEQGGQREWTTMARGKWNVAWRKAEEGGGRRARRMVARRKKQRDGLGLWRF